MAKKNNDLESLGTALLLMALFITGVFFLFKWAIAGIIAILSVIVVGAINFKKKKEKERIFKEWRDSLFGDSYIRPTKKVDIEELKEKLDLLDTSIYDDQFDSEIIERGKDYVCRRKITRAHRKGNEWTATVKGRNSYNVKVELEDSKIKNAECDCLYFQDKQQYCKHIYATLYFTRSVQNCQKISDSIGTFLHQLSKLIVMENNYIKTHKDTLHPDDVDERTQAMEKTLQNAGINFIRRERFSGRTSRNFFVGDISEEDVKASFENGVLKVVYPKVKEVIPEAKKITIE